LPNIARLAKTRTAHLHDPGGAGLDVVVWLAIADILAELLA
jgi:hypothetical protein